MTPINENEVFFASINLRSNEFAIFTSSESFDGTIEVKEIKTVWDLRQRLESNLPWHIVLLPVVLIAVYFAARAARRLF